MTATAVNAAIVVIGKGFDPSRLNIDYLHLKEIVPTKWGWQLQGTPLVTPLISTVAFDKGASILVQQDRIQVVHAGLNFDPLSTNVQEIIRKLVTENTDKEYQSVGLNFNGVIPELNNNKFLMERFGFSEQKIKNTTLEKLEAVYFSSQRQDARLNFALKAGRMTPLGQVEQNIVLVEFNYDCQLGAKNASGALAAIDRFAEAWSDYSHIVSAIIAD
jgi:hypothetical protein